MASYTVGLAGGGEMTVNASSPQAAQDNVRAQGGTPTASVSTGGAGSVFNNTGHAYSAPTRAASSGGQGGGDLGKITQDILQSIATGNKAAFDEAVRQFNAGFGLDQSKFQESVRQFNQTFGEGQRQFNVNAGLNAAQLAGSLHADPFRQASVIGQLGNLLHGQGVAGFQAPNGSAADTQSVDYIINQIRNPAATQATADNLLAQIPAPNKVNARDFMFSSPETQNTLLSGIKAKFGIDPEDALAQIKSTLPGFSAPTLTGAVR